MALINCPECKAKISKKAKECPKCGCPSENFGKEAKVSAKAIDIKKDKSFLPSDTFTEAGEYSFLKFIKKAFILVLLIFFLVFWLIFSKEKEESCWDLGYRFGRCVAMSMKGRECYPEDDFVMPERCRNRKQSDKGMAAGMRSK